MNQPEVKSAPLDYKDGEWREKTPHPQGVSGCFCYSFSRRRENGSEMDKQQRLLTKQLKEFVANTIIYLLVSRRMYYFPSEKCLAYHILTSIEHYWGFPPPPQLLLA